MSAFDRTDQHDPNAVFVSDAARLKRLVSSRGSRPGFNDFGVREDRLKPRYQPSVVARLVFPSFLVCLVASMTGCSSLALPTGDGLGLMSPGSSLLFPGSGQHQTYQMIDGTPLSGSLDADGSLTEDAYNKIREAKAQNAVVLQVSGDSQPVRLLPLPPQEKSVFVSELLTQTGVLKKFGAVDVTLYRPSPDSIEGIKMDVKFADDGSVDPASDYGLRPGDRVQVRQRSTTALESLVNMALRR